MKRKLLSIIITASVALLLFGCGSSAKKPDDLTGTWKQVDAGDSYMEATIEGETISINWVFTEDNTTAIYWIGTYEAPTEYSKEYKWISERDKEKTDNALMASGDDTKEFTYSNNKISYSASMMGITSTIQLEKEK